MAFTKVSPAGIGSTPGDGYRIGDSFLHSTGVEITNINATGILTAASLDISGAIDFDGHTNLDNVSIAGVATFADNKPAYFGTDGDFYINHSGSSLGMLNTTGDTLFRNTGGSQYFDCNQISLRIAAGSQTMLNAGPGGVTLYTSNSSKLTTTNTGVFLPQDLDVDGHTNLDNVSIAGVTTISGTGEYLLQLSKSDSSAVYTQFINSTTGTSTSDGFRIGIDSNEDGLVWLRENGNLKFGTANDERLRIDSSGRLLLGHTASVEGGSSSLQAKLQVSGTDFSSSAINLQRYQDNSTAAAIAFNKSRNGTQGSHTILQDGDELGKLIFYGSDGNDFQNEGARIFAQVDGTPGNNVMPGSLIFRTTAQGAVGSSERLRITSGGKVNIGGDFDASTYGLQVWGSGGTNSATLGIKNNVAGPAGIHLLSGHGNWSIFNSWSVGDALEFRDEGAGSTRMLIDSSGNVLVGTTDSTVFGNGSGNGIVLRGGQAIDVARSNDLQLTLNRMGNDGQHIAFYRSGGVKSYISTRTNDFCIDVSSTNERLRIKANGDVQIGTAVDAGNALRYLDVANYNTGSSAGSILRLLTTKSDGSSSVGLDIVKYKSGGAYLVNYETVGADTGFIALSTGQNGASPAVRFRVAGNGETVITPTNGGASNNRTSIHFNNAAHSPFISFKSNNLTEASYILCSENTGGAHLNIRTKRKTGAQNAGSLLSVIDFGSAGEIRTYNAGGGQLSYPLVTGASIGSSGAEYGQFNYHDMRSPEGGLGGWVNLGIDYNPSHPYPRRAYKIAQHENGRNGTRVYHLWHDGDANYHYGGMWEIRLNEWNSTSNKFESVHFRCINGRRNDVSLYVYDTTDGIWIRPHTIWGRFFLRRAGWDDGGRAPGSSYCAVTNGAALAFGDTSGANGSIPSGYFELFPFDGAGGSHTGGRYIENNTNSDG